MLCGSEIQIKSIKIIKEQIITRGWTHVVSLVENTSKWTIIDKKERWNEMLSTNETRGWKRVFELNMRNSQVWCISFCLLNLLFNGNLLIIAMFHLLSTLYDFWVKTNRLGTRHTWDVKPDQIKWLNWR